MEGQLAAFHHPTAEEKRLLQYTILWISLVICSQAKGYLTHAILEGHEEMFKDTTIESRTSVSADSPINFTI